MADLAKGAETLISIAWVVICAEKICRLLSIFFVTILLLLLLAKCQRASGRSIRFAVLSQLNCY